MALSEGVHTVDWSAIGLPNGSVVKAARGSRWCTLARDRVFRQGRKILKLCERE